jgi:hypothetical protein
VWWVDNTYACVVVNRRAKEIPFEEKTASPFTWMLSKPTEANDINNKFVAVAPSVPQPTGVACNHWSRCVLGTKKRRCAVCVDASTPIADTEVRRRRVGGIHPRSASLRAGYSSMNRTAVPSNTFQTKKSKPLCVDASTNDSID